MIIRALLAIAIVGVTIPYAGAQFGGMPGMPGSGGPGGGFGGPPQGPPPKCKALLEIRDELQKHGEAISTANQKKADVKVACGLFRKYIATEAKMIKMLEVDGPILRRTASGHAAGPGQPRQGATDRQAGVRRGRARTGAGRSDAERCARHVAIAARHEPEEGRRHV